MIHITAIFGSSQRHENVFLPFRWSLAASPHQTQLTPLAVSLKCICLCLEVKLLSCWGCILPCPTELTFRHAMDRHVLSWFKSLSHSEKQNSCNIRNDLLGLTSFLFIVHLFRLSDVIKNKTKPNKLNQNQPKKKSQSKSKTPNSYNNKSSKKFPSPRWKKKTHPVVFDLRLFHLFHLISVGYRWNMEKGIANGSSGSTSSTPIWLSQLSASWTFLL